MLEIYRLDIARFEKLQQFDGESLNKKFITLSNNELPKLGSLCVKRKKEREEMVFYSLFCFFGFGYNSGSSCRDQNKAL